MGLWKNIFISYASEDMGLVKSVASSLWNIGLDPIKAEDTRAHDKSSIEKIKESIRDSNVFVVIFTNNSISNQWVNQELGYAERVRETTPYPLIIPVVEKEIASNVKGFYNKSVTDFIMFDEGDSASMIHDLLKDIRKYVNRNFVVDKVRIRCPHCGNVQEYGAVPSQDDIEKAITKNESFSYNCKQCVKVINLNPKTFQIIGTDNK